MKPELQNKLMRKYPKIFRQANLSPQETCMCWGIECGNGWYNIIDDLCGFIQCTVDNGNCEQVEAVQVKEKFGTLRFYVNIEPDMIFGAIAFAGYLSSKICEECGSRDQVESTQGWIKYLCKVCREKREGK